MVYQGGTFVNVTAPDGSHSHYPVHSLPDQFLYKASQTGHVAVELRTETNVDQFVLVPHTGLLRAMLNTFSETPLVLSYNNFEDMEEALDNLLDNPLWENTTKIRIVFGLPVVSSGDNNHSTLKLIVNNMITSRHKSILQIGFVQGWDMYNNDVNFANAYKDTLAELSPDDCYFYLCNTESLQQFQKAIPRSHCEYYSIYPSRINILQVAETHPKFFNQSNRNINKRRTRKTMCLNNSNKSHREKIVNILNDYNTNDHYVTMREKQLYLKPERILGAQPGGVHSHNFLALQQDCPPLRYMVDTYTYIATETYNDKEQISGLAWQIGEAAGQHWEELLTVADFSGWWTEKTFKAIYYELPFMVVGVPDTLKGLKSLGFETFPELFDERYDSPNTIEVRDGIYERNIEKIMSMSHSELHDMYYSDAIQEKLKHNKQLFYGLIENDPFN